MTILLLHAALLLPLAALAGWAVRPLKVPPLLGMILAGVLVGNFLLPWLPQAEGLSLVGASQPLRLAVLALVLLRAGLGVSLGELRRAGGLALGLGLVPMLADAAMVTVAGVYLLDLRLAAAAVLGFLVAAISPAIVIPGLLDMLGRRRKKHRRVLTALLAGAPLDNIVAVLALGISLDLALAGGGEWGILLLRLGRSVLLAIAVGLVAGWLWAQAGKRLGERWLWLQTISLLLLAWGLIPLSAWVGLDFVVAVLFLGGAVRVFAPEQVRGLNVRLAQVWQPAQVCLFALIGAAVRLEPLAVIGLWAVLVVLAGQVGRAVGATVVARLGRLDWRHGLACSLAYVPKATIQAAMAALPFERGLPEGGTILAVAVLAVVITAPVGVLTLHKGTDRLLPVTEASG